MGSIGATEQLRALVVDHIASIKHWNQDWPLRRRALVKAFGSARVEPDHVVDIGDELRRVFRTTSSKGRGQSQLALAGAHFCGLVTYYLNLCLLGTAGIAVSAKYTPDCLRRALRVRHRSATVSSDIDIAVLFHPGLASLAPSDDPLHALEWFLQDRLDETTLVIVQTKTSWADNTMAPMLWNMLYSLGHRASLPADAGLTFGEGRMHLSDLRHMFYAFVTAPTQDLKKFTPAVAPVVRAMTMSGGNYWCVPSQSGVAASIKELLPTIASKAPRDFVSARELGVLASAALNGHPTDTCDFGVFRLT
jgi:hypothetical protein